LSAEFNPPSVSTLLPSRECRLEEGALHPLDLVLEEELFRRNLLTGCLMGIEVAESYGGLKKLF